MPVGDPKPMAMAVRRCRTKFHASTRRNEMGGTWFDEPTQLNIAREIQRCSLPTVLSNVVQNAPDCHTRSLL